MSISIDRGRRVVKVGDHVGFKCDVEQYGVVKEINYARRTLILEPVAYEGFEGAYLGGCDTTEEDADRCW